MDTNALFSLSGKVVLVTGASSGLGERFAEVAAASGASVVLVSRRGAVLEALKSKIEAAGGKAHFAVADVNDEQAMRAAFDSAEQAFGIVDVFVANAGIASGALPLDAVRQRWRAEMATDLEAVFFWSQEAARRLIAAAKPGSIITIASVAGMSVVPGMTAYSVAKAAVIHATKLLALQLGPHKIRVNCIAPGYIVTRMNRGFLVRPQAQEMMRNLPLGRFGQPSDLDGAFLLLASDAGRLMTGSTIVVDSGHMLAGGS